MKWEYLTVSIDYLTDDEVNNFGKGGWELVAVDNGKAYFKKEIKFAKFAGLSEIDFEPAKDIHINWMPGSINFDCSCGANVEMNEGDEYACRCGRLYRLVYRIEMHSKYKSDHLKDESEPKTAIWLNR